ncbi:MAG TPA: MotA/TolQ/ExbB proton channel family protein [Candidatus Acidoferrales bacterium]|jgi:biopolymer transport protein ExbB/TolQ|nr:MotA/TolQ/ExbB proton channel family protein [Candidatus Acidoferrales bacterium]
MSHITNWDLRRIYDSMSPFARDIVILLLAMLARAAYVALDKYACFAAARKQTRSFLRLSAAPLRDGDIAEAQRVAERKGESHLAKIAAAGIRAFTSAEPSLTRSEKIDAARRSARQVMALNRAEFNRRLSGLGTIAATAPFVGLLGTVVGILNAFRGIDGSQATGLSAVASGIAEALITTALGMLVAIPAVWCFNYFNDIVSEFQVEMESSSRELVTYLTFYSAEKEQRE